MILKDHGIQLHTVLQVRPQSTDHKGHTLTSPADSAGPAANQGTVGHLGSRAHCWLIFCLPSARQTFLSVGLPYTVAFPILYVQPGLQMPRYLSSTDTINYLADKRFSIYNFLFTILDGVEDTSCQGLEKISGLKSGCLGLLFLLSSLSDFYWCECECRIRLVGQRTSLETMMAAVVSSVQQDA